MINFSFFDNIIDFLNELIELLKEDWKKFKLFARENKKNLIWLFIALITLQYTDLLHVGNSCNKYYKTQTDQIQKGGSTAPPVVASSTTSSNSATPPPVKPKRGAPPPIDRSTKPKPGAKPGAAPPPAPLTPDQIKAKRTDAAKKHVLDKKQGKSEASESKNVQKNLDLFEKIKGKKEKLGKNGMAGPIFSNLEGIFSSVGALFSVLLTILTILGILSLPVLIFIIITYCVVKKMLGHIALI